MQESGDARIVEQLSSSDPMERRLAIESVDPERPESLEIFISALQDSHKGVRDAASQILMYSPSEIAAKKLVLLLGNDSIEIRNLASELLVAYGEEAVEPLLQEMHSDDHDIRKFVVDILGLIRDERAFNGLVKALDDPEPNVAVSAAEALGNIGDNSAVPELISHFASCEGMDYIVIEALGKLISEESINFLIGLVKSEELTHAQVALNALQTSEDPQLAANLYQQLDQMDPVLRQEAVASIITIYMRIQNEFPEFFDAKEYNVELCELLSDPSYEYRMDLVQNLPDSFVVENVLFLLNMNANHVEELDEAITYKLSVIEFETFKNKVEEIFNDTSREGQMALTIVLAQKNLASAIPFMERLINLPDPSIKENFLQVLSANPDSAAIPILQNIIESGDETLQDGAYYVLTLLKDPSLQEIFEKGLESNSLNVREMCGEALSQVAPARLAEIVGNRLASDDEDDLIFALDVATRFPAYGSFQSIASHLENDSSRVRAAAVRAISNLQHSEAYDAIDMLMTDLDDDVRRAAFDAMLKLEPDQVERPIWAALSDENFWLQIAGIETIVQGGFKQFKKDLLATLGASNKMVQMKAIEALIQLFGEAIELDVKKELHLLGEDGESLINSAKEQLDASWF